MCARHQKTEVRFSFCSKAELLFFAKVKKIPILSWRFPSEEYFVKKQDQKKVDASEKRKDFSSLVAKVFLGKGKVIYWTWKISKDYEIEFCPRLWFFNQSGSKFSFLKMAWWHFWPDSMIFRSKARLSRCLHSLYSDPRAKSPSCVLMLKEFENFLASPSNVVQVRSGHWKRSAVI